MRVFEFSRLALCISVAPLSLAACGGSSIPIATDNPTLNALAPKGGKTFHYTGGEQKFIVPNGVTQLTVVAHGGEGAGFSTYPSTDTPGRPGRVHAIISVHAGDKLYVFVGASGAHGGFNGGGPAGGAPGYGSGNPGGGASDIRSGGSALQDRIIVAAGGGGAGQVIRNYGSDYGGSGGGLVGKSGGSGGSDVSGGGGAGGTQSVGGLGGPGAYSYDGSGQPGGNGALGVGGNGGNSACDLAGGGGGGGGGYYGGGGGGGGAAGSYCYYENGQGGGGGGGSSYVEPGAIKSRMWTGWKAKGDGLVFISWK